MKWGDNHWIHFHCEEFRQLYPKRKMKAIVVAFGASQTNSNYKMPTPLRTQFECSNGWYCDSIRFIKPQMELKSINLCAFLFFLLSFVPFELGKMPGWASCEMILIPNVNKLWQKVNARNARCSHVLIDSHRLAKWQWCGFVHLKLPRENKYIDFIVCSVIIPYDPLGQLIFMSIV